MHNIVFWGSDFVCRHPTPQWQTRNPGKLETRGRRKKVPSPLTYSPPVHRSSTSELTTTLLQHRNNTNEPARNSRRSLHRQCQRLCRLARRRGTHATAFPGDDLQISIYGAQYPAPSGGPPRKDSRHQEDIRRRAVLEDAERSRSSSPVTGDCMLKMGNDRQTPHQPWKPALS